MTNSLTEYYKLVFIKIEIAQVPESTRSMALSEFKLPYEKFCFLKRYEERLMTTQKNELLLKKYGFEIQKKIDKTT